MNATEITSTLAGAPLLCDNPMDQPWLSLVYFVSFIFICSFSMLSLFVGAITVSMSESMETMREEKFQKKKKLRLQQAEKKLKNSIKTSVGKGRQVKQEVRKQSMQQRRAWRLVAMAFKDGGKVENALEEEDSDDFVLIRLYKKLAIKMRNITEESFFQNFITFVIIVAGVQVGMNTDARMSVDLEMELYWVDYVIRIIFTVECVLKIIAEELQPWTYFESNWNVFDFVVVVGSYVSGGGSLIVMLRLLRLLRVLKLMRMLPQLQVIVTALMSGFSSITFISIILLLFFYFFGIIAMILFSTNDPLHFGNLHITMIALFQCSTLDNWTDLLYINLYGCDVIGYDEIPEQCTNPKAAFITTSLYFIVFILMGALVLLTLFIGVVATSMEEATEEQKTQTKVDTAATKVSKEHGLQFSTVCLYREVFSALDLNGGNIIDMNELRLGLTAAGRDDISSKQFSTLWRSVDQDNSGGIDFSEFLLFMIALRDQKGKYLNKQESTDQKERVKSPPPPVVMKQARSLSAPRAVLRKVQGSVQATLCALRLQHGHPVVPVGGMDVEKREDMIMKQRSFDHIDVGNDEESSEVRFFDRGNEIISGPGSTERRDTNSDTGKPNADANVSAAVVPGRKPSGWVSSQDFSTGQVNPSRKNQHQHMQNNKEYAMVPMHHHQDQQQHYNNYNDDVSSGLLPGSSEAMTLSDTTPSRGLRSYEDRKKNYTPSNSHSSGVLLPDSRSFILDTPYITTRTSPTAKNNALGKRSGEKKQVVSKACFI